jgi:hypothetical protein
MMKGQIRVELLARRSGGKATFPTVRRLELELELKLNL